MASLAAVLVAFATASGATPAERLRAAHAAENQLTFRGRLNTATFAGSASVSSEVVIYRKPGCCRLEYQSPALRGLVMIENGDRFIRLNPDQKTAYVGFARREPGRLELLLKNYTVASEGVEPLMGQPADVLTVRHARAGHPSKKIWVHRETSLILRSEYYSSDGALASRTVYSEIEWNPRLDDRLFEIPAEWKQITLEDDSASRWDRTTLAKEAGFTLREPAHLPEGYVFDGFKVCRCRSGVVCVQMRYADGLNSFSIFERFSRCPGRCCGPGHGKGWRWRQGSQGGCELLACQPGRVLTRDLDGLTCIFVGDLPEEEMTRIANSLK
ncbi:MAG: hypothetical protein N2689_11495 [Verrucomicrobiae bacterium]|nr:hypothetical protein [Verrucomicrobiae bacterium]